MITINNSLKVMNTPAGNLEVFSPIFEMVTRNQRMANSTCRSEKYWRPCPFCLLIVVKGNTLNLVLFLYIFYVELCNIMSLMSRGFYVQLIIHTFLKWLLNTVFFLPDSASLKIKAVIMD